MPPRRSEGPKKLDKDPEPTLVGKTFRIGEGLEFKVEADAFFPEGKHDKQNGKYLDDVLQEGELASVFYQGIATPLVRVKGGVVKLNQIRVGNEVVKKSFNISAKLNILDTRQAVALDEVK